MVASRLCLRHGKSGNGSSSVALAATGTLEEMSGIGLSLLFGAPWLAATVWTWWRAPRVDVVPLSMGERARQRLEMT